jgi:transcriptional/translational regulatory protein YebC/TACO1
MFSRIGRITLTPREGADPQDVWDAAIDAGAEDVNSNPDESTREMEVRSIIPLVFLIFIN